MTSASFQVPMPKLRHTRPDRALGPVCFVPEWGILFVSARREGEHSAEILVYETRCMRS